MTQSDIDYSDGGAVQTRHTLITWRRTEVGYAIETVDQAPSEVVRDSARLGKALGLEMPSGGRVLITTEPPVTGTGG